MMDRHPRSMRMGSTIGYTERRALCAMPCLLALVIITASTGCVKVGPDFVPPKAEVSESWLEASDPRVKTGAADYQYWWQVFNDPVLDRLDVLIEVDVSDRVPARRVDRPDPFRSPSHEPCR